MGGPFMERMWRNLPSDVLEKVVTFLPIASLCRFRTVSKRWNRLISHPDFASIHARATPPEDYVLVTMRFESRPISNGWEVLDVANKRFFTLSDDFLTEFMMENKNVDFSRSFHERALLAADGGLFCLSYTSFNDKGGVTFSGIFVCNPVLKTVKQLPFVEWVEHYQNVVMSTDRLSMEYEIFLINYGDDMYFPREFHIYESKAAAWRTAPFYIPQLHTQFAERRWCPVSPFIKDEFYKVYTHHDHVQTEVLSYDKVTGVGSELGIVVPTGADDLLLVVSNDRLFCVSEDIKAPSIKIFEIFLASNECIRFAEMPMELLYWFLKTDQGDYQDEDDDDTDDGSDSREEYDARPPILATGSANCILICSWVGRSVVYSLSNRSWYPYPDNDLANGEKFSSKYVQQLYASSYCLSLCAP